MRDAEFPDCQDHKLYIFACANLSCVCMYLYIYIYTPYSCDLDLKGSRYNLS